jgi:hypothetical protein
VGQFRRFTSSKLKLEQILEPKLFEHANRVRAVCEVRLQYLVIDPSLSAFDTDILLTASGGLQNCGVGPQTPLSPTSSPKATACDSARPT